MQDDSNYYEFGFSSFALVGSTLPITSRQPEIASSRDKTNISVSPLKK